MPLHRYILSILCNAGFGNENKPLYVILFQKHFPIKFRKRSLLKLLSVISVTRSYADKETVVHASKNIADESERIQFDVTKRNT